MSKIQIDINEELTNKMNELNQNIGYSKAKFIRTLINQCFNMTVVEFEDMVTGRNKPKDQPIDKVFDQPIDKPIDEVKTPVKVLSEPVKPLKELPGTAKMWYELEEAGYIVDDLTRDEKETAWRALPEVIPELIRQYIEEPDPNEPDDY